MKADWKTIELAQACDVFADGDWIESKDQSEEGIRLIQTGNIGQGEFKNRNEKARYISESTFSRLRCSEIVEGDCLISRLPDPVGRSCILPETGEKMITAVDCTIVRFKSDLVIPEFFTYYSQSHEYLYEVDSKTTGTTRKRISRANLGEVRIPAPPLAVQRRIVGTLDKAFAAVATAKTNTEKNLFNARALFEAQLQSIFSTSTRGWAYKTLEQVCHQVTDGKHGDCTDESDSGFYFLSAKDVKTGTLNYENARQISKVDFEETHRRTNLEPGDILVTNAGTIGRMAIAPSDERTVRTTFQKSVAVLKPIRTEIDSKFMFYCMSSGLTQLVSLSAGAAQKNLLLRDLRNYRLALPKSIEEQRRVAEWLDAVAAETQQLESTYTQEIRVLGELKASLLEQAFAGAL